MAATVPQAPPLARPPADHAAPARGAAPASLLAGLALVLALALGLRLSGLDWGLPWAFHPDEIFYVDQAEDILRFGDPNPRYFKNPSLLTYLIAGELLLARALGPLAGPFDSALPGSAYLTARLNSALLGTASVALVFALGALLFSRKVGLLAALLLAVAFLHVRDSHYGVNDVPATFWLLLSLYGAARLAARPALRWYLLAGLAGGLATSTKYNVGFFFAPILVAHWIAWRGGGGGRPADPRPLEAGQRASSPLSLEAGQSASSPLPLPLGEGRGEGVSTGSPDATPSPQPSPSGRETASPGDVHSGSVGLSFALLALSGRPLWLVAAGLASLAGYLLGTPYTLLDFRRFRADFLTQYHYGDQRWLGQPLEPVPLLYLTSLLQGFGALALALALVGLIWALRTRTPRGPSVGRERLVPRAAGVLLVAFPLVYLAFLLPRALFFPRFLIPLLPNLALLAACGAVVLAGLLARRWQPAGLALLVALALLQPLGNSLLHNRLLLQTDTRIVANEWVQANLPSGSRVKVEDYALRDLSTASRTYTPNRAELKIERFDGSPETEQARTFAERGVQYVVTSSFAFERYLLEPPLPGQRETGERYQRLHRSLERRAALIATIGPGPGGGPVPYRLDDVLTPFWSLPDYERPGPTLRIYSLEQLAE
jgi:4-amino-4-deoxy-L-arabinose transferase-like glycosyltransferase